MIRKSCCFALAAACAFACTTSSSQAGGVGASYGSREPHTCASRKAPASGAINAAQAKQYFQCDAEMVTTRSDGPALTLVTGVSVQVSAGRPFMMGYDDTGDNMDDGIDPQFAVYPIRGSFTEWTCYQPDASSSGHNCGKIVMPHAKGICFMSNSREWHCRMTDFSPEPPVNDQPAPKTD
jgi:hypothetical protein